MVRIVSGFRLAACAGLVVVMAACAPNTETASISAAPKAAAAKNFTSFTPALRCMDDLFLAYGKKDIVLTTAGIPDSTGKVAAGTKEMLISAISKMSIKSKAISFIDYDTEKNDLLLLFQDVKAAGASNKRLPSYYIRGAITQLDENAIDSQMGGSVAMPFADIGLSKDQVTSLVSLDMNVGETVTQMILPGANSSNTIAVTRTGKSGEAGGKIGKAGVNINISLNKSEGLGASVRALIELGLIESMGKLTNVPYWKCLQIEKTNPTMMEQARDWFDGMSAKDQIIFFQRKLAGAGRYKGGNSGTLDAATKDAVARYQADSGMTATGRITFETYYSLLDIDDSLADGPDSQQKAAVMVPARSTGPIDVKMGSDRGDKPTYRALETLHATAQVNQDAFLYCYYKDGGGTIARVFPNRFQPQPFVKAGKAVSIPGEGTPFQIRFDQGGSREQVFCVASDRDLALPPSLKTADLTPLSFSSSDDVVAEFKKSNPMVGQGKLDIIVK